MIIIAIFPKFMDMIKELLNPLIRKNLGDGGKQRINWMVAHHSNTINGYVDLRT